MRHFDVQLIGGMVLHHGKIAEMRTGEGKTLVATLPAYLNALAGKGVHVVTVNDYLAQRDAEWMGRIYRFLGLTVGVNLSQMSHDDKQAAYAADITYGTNNEFGFDYLRDNMVFALGDRVQRGLHYAIVDEVDSILIDEARTPLIISGQADDNAEMYYRASNELRAEARRAQTRRRRAGRLLGRREGALGAADRSGPRARRAAAAPQAGLLPRGSSLYDAAQHRAAAPPDAALRAHTLYQRDQHYVVQDGEVIIVDEFTGRLMPGRRWSDGLHQAVEAKEGVPIQRENQTLASITFQNYFRMYNKLAGMTGTADTEASEFQQIYNLETMVIPTNKPMVRKDENDLVLPHARGKVRARSSPTSRIATSAGSRCSSARRRSRTPRCCRCTSTRRQLPHQVLNAKQHEREAEIVAQAGTAGRDHDRDQHGRPRHGHRARRQHRAADPGVREDTTLDPAEKEREIQAKRASGRRATTR